MFYRSMRQDPGKHQAEEGPGWEPGGGWAAVELRSVGGRWDVQAQ